ncbi:MAG: TolC family protein [Candidatus Omnitrophica bacterium]|nr:TolC family protein [Candidatus Omnitrophota bacterium]
MKKMMIPFLIIGLLAAPAAFAEAPAVPQAPASMTFLDCYEKILAHYPALKKRYEQLEQAKAGRNIAIADLFPHIQGTASMTTTNDPVGVFGMLLRQGRFDESNFEISELNDPGRRTDYHFGIEGEMLLFDSFSTISKIRSARRMVKSAALEADFTETEAGIVALETYLGILLAQEILNATEETKSKIDEDLKQAEDLNQKGMILGADFYAAKVTAAGIERERNRAQALLKQSRMVMNILMGEDPEFFWEPAGKLPEYVQDKGELRAWIAQAYQQRKDLVALDQMIDATRIETLRQKTSFLPRFYGFANLNEHTPDWHTGGQDYAIGIKGTMDFFDPSYPGRVKAAKHQHEALKADRQALRDEIAKGLAGELTRFETVIADLPVLKQASQDAAQASDLTAKLYQEGRKSIADLLQMRLAHLETAVGLRQLLLALELEYAKLLFLSGQLDEAGLRRMDLRLKGRS